MSTFTRPIVLLSLGISLSVVPCTYAQDRDVVGDPAGESPYDRHTGGVPKKRTTTVPSNVGTTKTTPTPRGSPVTAAEKAKEFPKSGILSTVVPAGYGKTGIPTISSPDIENETLPPISGSVARAGSNSWLAKVSNNTEDSYSMGVKVNQLSSTGSVVKSDTFSASLKAKSSVERTFTAVNGAQGAQLVLERYTVTAKAKPSGSPSTSPSPTLNR